MSDTLSFKCPCCTAALSFSGATGELTCEYCGASFSVEQAKAAQEADNRGGYHTGACRVCGRRLETGCKAV